MWQNLKPNKKNSYLATMYFYKQNPKFRSNFSALQTKGKNQFAKLLEFKNNAKKRFAVQ